MSKLGLLKPKLRRRRRDELWRDLPRRTRGGKFLMHCRDGRTPALHRGEVQPARRTVGRRDLPHASVLLFVGGRIASYALFGGILGVRRTGSVSPSPLVTALITIAAAIYMLIMGLDMLHLAPPRLKRSMPRMPKTFAHRITDAEGNPHPFAPSDSAPRPCSCHAALRRRSSSTRSRPAASRAGAATLLAFALGRLRRS